MKGVERYVGGASLNDDTKAEHELTKPWPTKAKKEEELQIWHLSLMKFDNKNQA